MDSDDPPVSVARISQAKDETFKFFRMLEPLEISEDNFVFLISGRYDYTDPLTAGMTYVVSMNLEKLLSNSNQLNPKKIGLSYQLFPNPSMNDVHITFEELFTGKLQVFTSTGIMVIEKEVKNQTNVIFDTSNLSSGPYIIKINDPDGDILKSSIFLKN